MQQVRVIEDMFVHQLRLECTGVHGSAWVPRLNAAGIDYNEDIPAMLGTQDNLGLDALGVLDVHIIRSSHPRLLGCGNFLGEAVHQLACEYELELAPMSVGCLLRTIYKNTDIRRWGFSRIVVMHAPIEFQGEPRLMQVEAGDSSACQSNVRQRLTVHHAGLPMPAPKMWVAKPLDVGFVFVSVPF